MKTMAAYNIGQYQAVVLALRVHASMVEQGLSGSAAAAAAYAESPRGLRDTG